MGAFPARHDWDRWFWPGFVVVAWVLVYLGFGEQVALRFAGKADYVAPPALVIHVFSVFAWLTLLSLQLALSRLGAIAIHRTLGWAALLVVPAAVWSAIAAEIYSERFYAAKYDDVIRFFPIPTFSMLSFGACALAALALRRNRATHMRLIFLATASVLVATFFRWWGDAIYDALAPGLWTEWTANYVGVALLVMTGIAYDLATRRSVHPVYRIAAPLMLAGQLGAVAIGQSDWWPPVGTALLSLPQS